MLDVAEGEAGVALRHVVRLRPGDVGAQAAVAADAHDGGLGERLAGRQPVQAAAVEFLAVAVAVVELVVVDDEAFADDQVLAADRQVHAVLAELRHQVAGFPADVEVFPFGLAFVAALVAAGVAVAPGAAAEDRAAGVDGAVLRQAALAGQAELDEAFLPGAAALLGHAVDAVVALLAAEPAVGGVEVQLQEAVVVVVQIPSARVARGQLSPCDQRARQCQPGNAPFVSCHGGSPLSLLAKLSARWICRALLVRLLAVGRLRKWCGWAPCSASDSLRLDRWPGLALPRAVISDAKARARRLRCTELASLEKILPGQWLRLFCGGCAPVAARPARRRCSALVHGRAGLARCWPRRAVGGARRAECGGEGVAGREWLPRGRSWRRCGAGSARRRIPLRLRR